MVNGTSAEKLGPSGEARAVDQTRSAPAQSARTQARSVLLVVPPFQSVLFPTMGVSQLKANLEAQGFPTEILYLNLRFAERIGVNLYGSIAEQSPADSLFGEFFRARAANVNIGFVLKRTPCYDRQQPWKSIWRDPVK